GGHLAAVGFNFACRFVAGDGESARQHERFAGHATGPCSPLHRGMDPSFEESGDDVPILLELKEGADLAGGFGTDLANGEQLLFAGALESIDAAKMLGENRSHMLADLRDTEPVHQTRQGGALAA